MPFPLRGFAGQDMALIGVFSFQTAAGRRVEALGRAPMGFHFGHNLNLTLKRRFSVFSFRFSVKKKIMPFFGKCQRATGPSQKWSSSYINRKLKTENRKLSFIWE
jgi:hypothetical protein